MGDRTDEDKLEIEIVEEETPEKEGKEPEIEVVDDTPEADKGRKALDREVNDPTDEELSQYSDKVQARIKDLTHARHDERRAREAAAREREAAVSFAQAALEENKQLKARLTQGETNFVTQAQKLADIEVEKASAALKTAHEAGDTDAFVEAQKALNRAQFLQERAKNFKPQPLRPMPAGANLPAQPAQPTVPPLDTKAQSWQARNKWFGKDKALTGFALGLHDELVEAGYDLQSDRYYDAIDSKLKESFPSRFKDDESTTNSGKRPATVVAPTNRATSAKKIRLTASQVNLAKRLNLPLEVYARQVAEDARKQNG